MAQATTHAPSAHAQAVVCCSLLLCGCVVCRCVCVLLCLLPDRLSRSTYLYEMLRMAITANIFILFSSRPMSFADIVVIVTVASPVIPSKTSAS
jgi:hypothetical protein